MKSAYELAMERLRESEPEQKPLTDEKKNELAEIEQRYRAKIAEREVFLEKQIRDAVLKRDRQAEEEVRKQLRNERLRLEEEMEDAKNRVRNS